MRARASLVVAVLALCAASAGAAEGNGTREIIRNMVEEIRLSGEYAVGGTGVASVTVLPQMYEQADFRPLWSNPASIEQLVAAIGAAGEDGLAPEDYHRAAILRLRAEVDGKQPPDPARLASLDVLLTDGLVRFAYHLFLGKVDPRRLDSHWNLSRRISGRDPVVVLREAIDGGTVDSFLRDLRPHHPYYVRLRSALATYRDIAARGGWPTVPAGRPLKPGATDERVDALRRRLAASGLVDGGPQDSRLFDDRLREAVARFQRQHGLDADGVVGPSTLRALNVPARQRVDQIRVNLERARWVLDELGGEFIVVDIAGFRVSYMKGGQVLWRSRAQVGKPFRETPVFKSEMTYLVFNPTWTVPPVVLAEDVLPSARRDPGYFARRKIRVLDSDGNTVNPSAVNWSQVSSRGGPYRYRQEPGRDNALGRIKFMFPNPHSVYLHDTPNKQLFDRTERAFSSGCIRIERPFELAELLLDDPVRWSKEGIRAAVDSRRTRTVRLPRPVPILLLYWTVDFDEQGEVLFKRDLYDRDPAVLKALDGEFSERPLTALLEKPNQG